MKAAGKFVVACWLVFAVFWTFSQPGCSRSSNTATRQPIAGAASRVLSAEEAASLAARLANDQCEHQYRKRPFTAAQHSAVLKNDIYEWGGLDVGGPGGFSALVTFRPDGSDPHVEVYYSNDTLGPPQRR
jgi:hypothetical protein